MRRLISLGALLLCAMNSGFAQDETCSIDSLSASFGEVVTITGDTSGSNAIVDTIQYREVELDFHLDTPDNLGRIQIEVKDLGRGVVVLRKFLSRLELIQSGELQGNHVSIAVGPLDSAGQYQIALVAEGYNGGASPIVQATL